MGNRRKCALADQFLPRSRVMARGGRDLALVAVCCCGEEQS